MERKDKALLLQFITGSSSVPPGGFRELPIQIESCRRYRDRLPTAHTCFNKLDLPSYSSRDMLRQQLTTAIREGTEGFAFS